MSIDALPSKQASAQSSLSALSTLSSAPKGSSDAPSSFENFLTEARSTPVQSQTPKERAGNTSKSADKDGSTKKNGSDSDAVENANRNDDAPAETAAPTAEAPAPTPTPATPVTADGKGAETAQDNSEAGSDVDAVELADAQNLLAAQAAALAATQTNPVATGASAGDRTTVQAIADNIAGASQAAEQMPISPGQDRKTVKKENILRVQDKETDAKASDTHAGKEETVDASPVIDGARTAVASKSGKGKEPLASELLTGNRDVGNTKARTGEQDFASILSPAISNASAMRQHTEPLSSIAIANLPTNPHYEVSASLDSPRFGNSIAGHLSTIISQSVDRADIQLNPRELGPIRVEVTVKDRETHVTLIANEPRTVQALDQSANMLRTLLTDQGLTLGQFEVRSGSSGSDRSSNQQAWQNPGGQGQPGNQGSGSDNPALADLGGLQAVQRSSRRLLDLFA